MSIYLVDILMPVYNQEKFIQDALNGVVMQKTSFKYRLVIGEDFSTDRTRSIIERYVREYPDIIEAFYREKNLGPYGNSGLLFKEMKAKYIAICEGDDYWTDPFKLQKQVDFMESNPEYSICYHLVEILNADGKFEPETLNTSVMPRTYTVQDLALGNIIHTPSVLFRNGLIGEFPEWFTKCAAADYVMHMLNARKGKIYFMPEVMAVYRIHSGGIWSKVNLTGRTKKWLETLGYLIDEFETDPSVQSVLKYKYAEQMNLLSELYAEEKDFKLSASSLVNALTSSNEFAERWMIEFEKTKKLNDSMARELSVIRKRFLFRLGNVARNPKLIFDRLFTNKYL
jgi:glycosyltransferase involved in cell wall biosynthesis